MFNFGMETARSNSEMTSIEDERNAAQEAETIIRSLKPSTRYAKIYY